MSSLFNKIFLLSLFISSEKNFIYFLMIFCKENSFIYFSALLFESLHDQNNYVQKQITTRRKEKYAEKDLID